jgi:hypothetical protein
MSEPTQPFPVQKSLTMPISYEEKDPSLLHQELIGRGVYGEVHKVWSLLSEERMLTIDARLKEQFSICSEVNPLVPTGPKRVCGQRNSSDFNIMHGPIPRKHCSSHSLWFFQVILFH